LQARIDPPVPARGSPVGKRGHIPHFARRSGACGGKRGHIPHFARRSGACGVMKAHLLRRAESTAEERRATTARLAQPPEVDALRTAVRGVRGSRAQR